MDYWNDKPTLPPRTLRFVVGEIALLNIIDFAQYYMMPCEVIDRGPMKCGHCKNWHDYNIKLCDGKEILVDDCDLKKFQPPADEKHEEYHEDLEVSA